MKMNIFGIDGKQKGEITLAKAFNEKVRTDLIKRAVLAERSVCRQPYGADPLAGKRTSAHYHGKRHYKFTMMNREMARMKRIHGSGFLSMTARFVTQATKGRKAHPPKIEKSWDEKINRKEWLKAFNSAIAATADMDIVAKRSHSIEGVNALPIIIDDKLSEIKKSAEVRSVLVALGLEKELIRVAKKKQRAGKGKMRGRKTSQKTGPLIIVAKDNGIVKAARNLAGVEVVTVDELNVELLAPGTHPGRLCLFTKSAIEELDKPKKKTEKIAKKKTENKSGKKTGNKTGNKTGKKTETKKDKK